MFVCQMACLLWGENMVRWTENATCKVHTRVQIIFNHFVSPFTISNICLYSFLKVHNFFLNGSIILVYSLFSSYINLLKWLLSMWIFFSHFIYLFTFPIIIMFEQENCQIIIMPWALLNVIIDFTPLYIYIIQTYCS